MDSGGYLESEPAIVFGGLPLLLLSLFFNNISVCIGSISLSVSFSVANMAFSASFSIISSLHIPQNNPHLISSD